MSRFERYCYCAILLYIISGVSAYQFDVDNAILYDNPIKNQSVRGSYFGYSVELWTHSNKSWIFVGAPRANSSLYSSHIEPGTIYRCEFGEQCKELVMGSGSRSTSPQDRSWLGGTLKIGMTGEAVVCAPGWSDTIDLPSMRGNCYKLDAAAFSTSMQMVGEALAPLHGAKGIYNRTTYLFALGESGFSLHIVPNAERLKYVLGVPGALNWQGTPIMSHEDDKFIIPDPLYDSSVQNCSYSGYAVTSGCYFGVERSCYRYVTGAPRAHNLLGKVIVFEFPQYHATGKYNKINWTKKNIVGEQVGEYFGAALASCDINGDKRDDLLIGAPQWSAKSDEGRVYILRGNTASKAKHFKNRVYIDGETEQGRFGSAITCLGDIDYDGYEDFAVGAPYDGRGAVLIYHGARDGEPRLTQKINGPEDTRGFGISISEPKDIDNNSYVDIAVGAYLSGHVVLIRSKRVVNMTITLSTPASVKLLERNATQFPLLVCSSYDGKYPPNELLVSIELRINEIFPRAEIDIGTARLTTYKYNKTLKLSERPSCITFNITVKPNIKDFRKPLKLSATQYLGIYEERGLLRVTEGGDPINVYLHNSSVVMKEIDQKAQGDLIMWFAGDCGGNSTCHSNLSIHLASDLSNASQCVFGTAQIVQLIVTVTNTGDKAFGTVAVVYIPNYVELSSRPDSCEEVKTGDNIRVSCPIGDPLNSNETKNISLGLDIRQVPTNTGEIFMNAEAITRSENVASETWTTRQAINCIAKTDIGIAGNTDIDSHHYTINGKQEELLDIPFQHIFEIKNYEVSPIAEVHLSVSFPTHWIQGSKKIEVIRLRETTGDLDDEEFGCTDPIINEDFGSLSPVPEMDKKFNIVQGQTLAASPENRTLYINCTNPLFRCETIHCIIRDFQTARSAAKLFLRFDLLLPNFISEIIQRKDIIFFVSDARASLPINVTQTVNNKTDSILVGTTFTGAPLADKLGAWLVPTSVFIGLLLLVLVIIGLFKFGFFKRSKKEQLDALLKEAEHVTPKVLIETTSSTEASEFI